MMHEKPTKIQLRSDILSELKQFNSGKVPTDEAIERVIADFLKVEDKKLLAKTVLIEISGEKPLYDNILTLLLVACAPTETQSIILDMLSLGDISDIKKMQLINILREINSDINYSELLSYIKNPDEVADFETKRFMESAKMSPEAQIDFLDFFFGVSEYDQTMLLNSVASDFSSNEFANILSLIIFYTKNDKITEICLNALLKTKSYLAFEPIEHIIQNCDNAVLINLAKKCKNELIISGLRENKNRAELYKDMLDNSAYAGAWVSYLDGKSNFVMMFKKEKQDCAVQTFCVVLNLKTGPLACFGFENLSEDEFKSVFKKIFSNSNAVKIDEDVAVKILNDNIKTAYNKGLKPPYELLSWRQVTYDIAPVEGNLDDFIAKSLVEIPLNDILFNQILKQQFLENWFIKQGENSRFNDILCKINTINQKENICNILDKEFRKIFEEENSIDKSLLYQAYFMKLFGEDELSGAVYSLINESAFKQEFLKMITKKSILEHFLSLHDSLADNDNIFKKNSNNLDLESISNITNKVEKW